MAFKRTAIPFFELANSAYASSTIAFYAVNATTFARESTLITLYAAKTGTTTAANPLTLDSAGKFSTPVYAEERFIAVVTDVDGEQHETGIWEPALSDADVAAAAASATAAATSRTAAEAAELVAEAAAVDAAASAASAAATLANALLKSNNLSDVLSAATALTNLGGQPVNSLLTAISGLAANGLVARTASGTSSARTITGTANEIDVTNGDGVSGNPTLRMSATWVARGSSDLTAGMVSIKRVLEKGTASATVATGTINYNVITQQILEYTSNASANWTLNVRGDGTTSLDSIMAVDDILTIVFLVKQGGTAYYQSAMTIDGGAVTPRWVGGTAPSAGNTNSVDKYTHTIRKTAAATFTVTSSVAKLA